MIQKILLAFIPVFVAVDAIGVLPIYISLTTDLTGPERGRIILQSMLTTFGIAVGFVFLGKAIFAVLGIAIGDFMIAGGPDNFSDHHQGIRASSDSDCCDPQCCTGRAGLRVSRYSDKDPG
jgi:hypothetical protein